MPRSEEELDAMAMGEFMKMASEIPGAKVIPMRAVKATAILADGSRIELMPFMEDSMPMQVKPEFIFIEFGDPYTPERGETITDRRNRTGLAMPSAEARERRKLNTIIATENSIWSLVERAISNEEKFAVYKVGECMLDRSD